MFNKAKNTPPSKKAATVNATETPPRPIASQSTQPSSRPSVSIIGSHTFVEGDINSDEDLTVEGRVKGIITCKQNTVTLGSNGYINGDVFAHTLHVSGEVTGNLVALHRATIHKGAQVSGTIVAPCLVLEDGSVFHGSIDMSPDSDVLQNAFSNTKGKLAQPSVMSSASDSKSQKIAVKNNETEKQADA